MSFEYYSKWWAGTRENLERLRAKDAVFVKATDKIVKDRDLASHLVGGVYAKYSMLVQDLGTILDQMAQPQKRLFVRQLMDAATIRLHELSEELRNIDISEYHYIDGALIELKLIPHDVEILDPILYYLREHNLEELWTKIKNGERIYTAPPPPPPPLTLEELAGIVPTEQQPGQPGEQQPAQPGEQQPGQPGEQQPGRPGEQQAGQPTEPQQPTQTVDGQPEVEKKLKKRPKKYVPEVKVLSQEEIDELKRKEKLMELATFIQAHERGRQARLFFFEKWKEHDFKLKIREGHKPPSEDTGLRENASVQIQKLWRGHCARQLVKRKELARRYVIGMIEPSWKSTEEFEKLERNLQKRRDLRDQRIKEYIEANINERDRVFRVIGPRLMEDIGDEIREWFHDWYTQVKNFDKYPPEEKGGTVLVVRGETMTPKQWIDEVERKRRQKVKDKGKTKEKLKAEKAKQKKIKADLKKKEKEKLKKEKLRKKKKKLKPWDFELEYEPTNAIEPFAKAIFEYHKMFDERKDADNPEEKHYMDVIHEEKCYEMQLELRKIVDEMMRLELELLEEALMKDRAKRKGKKYKKKKKKKKKKKRKKKKKGKKDITAKRTTEDLFQELVDCGIIHPYEEHYLKEYKGDFSYKNWELRKLTFDPPATLGDVRQAVKINCIAPLSTESMKKPRSTLIVGPRQSGKHLLAHAVFTESKSVLFDLSPEILEEKYTGKKGMKMLMHLVNKMARLLQPSVIYFNAAEKIFYKKVPKDEKHLDPKRIGKKVYKNIVKKIKPEDRLMVLGVTGKPWLANAKLKKTFERIILIPRPDYGSIYLYWRELLMPYHGIDRNIDVSCLTKLTVNYPLPILKQVSEKVLTPRRIIQLSYNPLKQSELYEELLTIDPITDKEYKKFLKFYKKTPLMKERNRLNKYNEKRREQEARAADKQKMRK